MTLTAHWQFTLIVWRHPHSDKLGVTQSSVDGQKWSLHYLCMETKLLGPIQRRISAGIIQILYKKNICSEIYQYWTDQAVFCAYHDSGSVFTYVDLWFDLIITRNIIANLFAKYLTDALTNALWHGCLVGRNNVLPWTSSTLIDLWMALAVTIGTAYIPTICTYQCVYLTATWNTWYI